jgi:hypothetical protein
MKKIISSDYKLKKKAQWQAHQTEEWQASQNENQKPNDFSWDKLSENKKYKGKWVPHLKGSHEDGYAEYEISIVREDYWRGFDSYGEGENLDNPHAAKLIFTDGRVLATSWKSIMPTLMEGAKLFADQMNSKNQINPQTPSNVQ